MDSKQAKIDYLEIQVAQKDLKIENLHKKMLTFQKEQLSTSQTLKQLSSKLNVISSNRKAEKLDFASLKIENSNLKKLIENLEFQLTCSYREIQNTKSENVELQDEIKLKSNRITKIKSHRENFELQLEAKNLEITKLKRRLKDKEIEMLDCKRALYDREDELDALRVNFKKSKLVKDQMKLKIEQFKTTEQKRKIIDEMLFSAQKSRPTFSEKYKGETNELYDRGKLRLDLPIDIEKSYSPYSNYNEFRLSQEKSPKTLSFRFEDNLNLKRRSLNPVGFGTSSSGYKKVNRKNTENRNSGYFEQSYCQENDGDQPIGIRIDFSGQKMKFGAQSTQNKNQGSIGKLVQATPMTTLPYRESETIYNDGNPSNTEKYNHFDHFSISNKKQQQFLTPTKSELEIRAKNEDQNLSNLEDLKKEIHALQLSNEKILKSIQKQNQEHSPSKQKFEMLEMEDMKRKYGVVCEMLKGTERECQILQRQNYRLKGQVDNLL